MDINVNSGVTTFNGRGRLANIGNDVVNFPWFVWQESDSSNNQPGRMRNKKLISSEVSRSFSGVNASSQDSLLSNHPNKLKPNRHRQDKRKKSSWIFNCFGYETAPPSALVMLFAASNL
jgi:hypothetical protein